MTRQKMDQLYRRNNVQIWDFPRKVLCLIAVVGVLAGALTILSCSGGGGGGGEQAGTGTGAPTAGTTPTPAVAVAGNDVVAPVNTATVQSLEGQVFTFPSGGALTPALANQPVTLMFTNTASATPTATVTAPGIEGVGTPGQPASFTADTTFASCHFRITSSTFPRPGPQVGDKELVVDPCMVDVQTGGVQATGQATVVHILLQLGATPSAANQATVSINPNTGVVTLNNVTLPNGVGSVTLVATTGTSGGTR